MNRRYFFILSISIIVQSYCGVQQGVDNVITIFRDYEYDKIFTA